MRKLPIALSVEQRGMRMSCCGLLGPFEALRPASDAHNPPFTLYHEEDDDLLNRCFKRICSWRVPPNWSAADWREEIRAHGLAASCEARCDYDESRGVPLDAFVYQRVIARAYSRFRREWAYGLRCNSETEGVVADGWDISLLGECFVQHRELSVEPDPAFQELREAVESLSEPNHQLIMHLFWEEQTEANIAEALGISHQAVNKRKRAAIQKLRTWLEVSTNKETKVLGKVAKSSVRCIPQERRSRQEGFTNRNARGRFPQRRLKTMSAGYISLFTNSSNFSDADLQNALPDFQAQVANEFNYFWGMYAYLDDGGGGSPLIITDYGGDPSQIGYLGYHSIDQNCNPYAIIYADVCVYYNAYITGVISHELLEMLADELVDTVDLYDNGDGTGVIVDQEVCDPCEANLYYEGAVNNTVVSDFVTPAWFAPGCPPPYDFLGAIGGAWQLASGGYVCYQDVTLSGLICVSGDKIQKTMAKAGEAPKRIANPRADVIRQVKSKGLRVQSPKAGKSIVVKRKDIPKAGPLRRTANEPPHSPAVATSVPDKAQTISDK
jgi:DNA-directed RNA polymerase specialized sigma24 family protein